MSHNKAPQAKLTTVAEFAKELFLEAIVARADGSFLVTVVNKNQLWYVPPPASDGPVSPICLQTFDYPTTGLVEAEPDVFLMLTGNFYTTHEAFVHRVDLRNWTPEKAVPAESFFTFPKEAGGLNGCCLAAPGVVLIADSIAGLIWKLAFKPGVSEPSVSVWLMHVSMGYYPGKMKPEQPGVNGVRYAAKAKYVYYTATAKKLMMRVAVDAATLEPKGEPEVVVAGRMGDDFCIDEDRQVLYLATHRQNTIDVVSMDPALNSGFTQSVAGDPYNADLVGPSSCVWGRGPGDQGRIAYFIMDGGTASPPPEGPHPAKLFRVDFQPLGDDFPGMST